MLVMHGNSIFAKRQFGEGLNALSVDFYAGLY